MSSFLLMDRLSSLIFLFTLISACSMFFLRLERRSHYVSRLIGGGLLMFAYAVIRPPILNDLPSYIISFSILFLVSIPYMCFCQNISIQDAAFCAIAGYSVQHICSVGYKLLGAVTGRDAAYHILADGSISLDFLNISLFIFIYAAVYTFINYRFARRIKYGENIAIGNSATIAIILLVLLLDIILSSIVDIHHQRTPDMEYFVCFTLTNLISTLLCLLVLFGQLFRKALKEELLVIEQLRQQEHKQYEISKETIDMINIKCHDMRHQIHALRHAETIDPDALKEIEKSINIYDSMIKSGNEALDVILAEKSLFCQKNGILINNIIDGEKLGFIRPSDIYSLFGNLLDNAINSVMKLDADHRIISLSVKPKDDLLAITCRNYYSGAIIMQNGLPQTSSENTSRHGFGVRSMKLLIDRYGGTITFSTMHDVFNVNILLPRNSSAEKP